MAGTPPNERRLRVQLLSQEPNSDSSVDSTPQMSQAPTNPPSPTEGGTRDANRPKHRVRFTHGGESVDLDNKRSSFAHRDPFAGDVADKTASPPSRSPTVSRKSSFQSLRSPRPSFGERLRPTNLIDSDISMDIVDSKLRRPQIFRNNSNNSDIEDIIVEESDDEEAVRRANVNETSQVSAQERAQRLASLVGSHSAPGSRTQSPIQSPILSPPPVAQTGLPVRVDDIPLIDLNGQRHPDDDEESLKKEPIPEPTPGPVKSTTEAHKLVRAHTKRDPFNMFRVISHNSGQRSGAATPTGAQDGEGYVPPPQQYRGGILSSLLKLYTPPHAGTPGTPGTPATLGNFPYHHIRANSSSAVSLNEYTPGTSSLHSPISSGAVSPRPKPQKWYYKQHEHGKSSSDALASLIGSTSMLASPAAFAGAESDTRDQYKFRPPQRPRAHRGSSWGPHSKKHKPRLEDEIKITVHIAEILSRQRYLLKICRALMAYGAPTHRLEEYLKMSARVLEIEGQFLYIPGCMVISFDDPSTHTTEVKLVRTVQGVDLGKLRDTHDVYKEVVHDVIGVEEATQRLDEIMKRKPKNPKWLLILVYGFASASVGPFAFQADWLDLPIAFILGTVLGILQLIVAPLSDLYANVFEIAAAVLTSFLARAFGSIPYGHGRMFCFSALAQSSIALILPGYMVLCASLELQSRSIIAGAVRMVNAIIYSLFLGFGITIGSVIYGAMDKNAVSQTKCEHQMGSYWGFLFVPIFTLSLLIINQAKWKQAPVMIIISFAGYIVNFFSSKRFPSNAQISQTLGAFTVGVLGNFYSRLRHGVAAAALLPAIFVQVPSGLAAGGSLISGVHQADQIVHNSTTNTTSLQTTYNTTGVDDVVYNVGYSMIQVAIGIAVGLSLSAILVYPLGKRRSGLFSF